MALRQPASQLQRKPITTATDPRSPSNLPNQLRQVAQRLAEVFAAASALVARTEEEIRRREDVAARIAEVLGKADPASRSRVMSARRAAGAAELLAAQALADELRYQAGSRALAAVHRYAGTLAAEAEEANAIGRAKIAELGAVLDGLDTTSAKALLAVVEKAEAQRIANAQRQAADLTAQIQAAIGSLPPAPVEFEAVRPRANKARRRARRGGVEARSDAEVAESPDVVVLDPKRRRNAP
jgi:hypothetical protein